MRTESATDRVRCELHRALDHMRADLDRVEILSAALNAFSKPVPDYEPGFQHLRNMDLRTHELG